MMYAEILLLLLIVGRQVWIVLQNRRLVDRVAALYPAADALDIERMTLQVPRQSGEGGFEVTEIDLLEIASDNSIEFQQIRTDTNEYLTNNKGAAADFSLLRDISERHAEALDEEVQAQIAAPLYWGLAGTFGGAILGLIPLFTALSADKLTSPTVSEFLGGVLIAMVGSLFGLLFTLWGNQLLKEATAHRDKLKNAYYTFLQVRLLPKLNSDMQKSMGDMKAVLDTFNEKFFTRIQDDFFAKLSQILPVMTQMGQMITQTSQNIAVQRDFLVKLEEVGITKMANATVKVFDRVDQSAATFEKFIGYQQALNQTLEAGKDVTLLIYELLERLSAIEQAANQMPTYLSKHDETLNNVLRLLIEHQSTLKTASSQMAAEIGQGADRMRGQLDHNLEELDAQAKAAHQRYQTWFERLNNDNVFEKIVQYLDPIKAIPAQQMELNKLQEKQSQLVARALTQLETRLTEQGVTQEELVRQVAVLADLLAYQSQPWHRRLSGFKPNGQPAR